MDVNEYMSKSLALLERIAEGIESLNESGIFIANQNDLENAIPVVVLGGGVSNVTNVAIPEGADAVVAGNLAKVTGKKDGEAKAQADKPAETAKDEAKPAEQAPKDEKPAETKKKVSVDDARAALKAYAAIEGNDAAMELLTSLKAKSVSDLAEQGPDALQKLIDKCEGKAD